MLRKVLLGSAPVAGGGVMYMKHVYDTDEGVRRGIALYSKVGPVILRYRFVQVKHSLLPRQEEEKQREWLELDEKYSDQVVAVLKELKGMYVKYGQMGAGATNTLSKVWTEKLRELEDAVPPQPLEVVLQTIREDTGKDPFETFSEIDPKPLGSASIGQVHSARIGNKRVAVKVQYPESRRMFRQDMKTIRGFMEIFAPEQVIIMEELEQSFEREFNYKSEAENLEFFSKNLSAFSKEAKVPVPIKELSTERMLVMELLEGRKLIDGVRAYAKVIAAEQGKTLEQFEQEMKEKFVREGAPSSYDGPPSWQVSLFSSWIRLRNSVGKAAVGVANVAMWPFTSKRLTYQESVLPPNAPRIMDLLMRVHGHELLVLGAFNADPHAGQFLLLPDGRVGLLDYGATKVLTREERLAACLLFAALHKDDKTMLLEMVRVSGYRSKNFDKDVIWDLVRFGFDTFGQDLLKGRNIQVFMDELYSRDPWYEAASNLTMAQFLSIRLRSVGLSCGYPVVCSQWWGPLALDVLKREGLPYETWDTAQITRILSPEKTTLSKGSKLRELLHSLLPK